MRERETTKAIHKIRELFQDFWCEEVERFRSPYVFRGLSTHHYPLSNSLKRLGGNYQDMEYHLLRNFRKYSTTDNNNSNYSFWKEISIAQHHYLPTRLFDWTFSPFVALHFCTVNTHKYNEDGAVWCVDFRKLHRLLPPRLKQEIDDVGSNVFSTKMLDNVFREYSTEPRRIRNILNDFSNTLKEQNDGKNFVVFFEPPSLDERIINQYALFSVMPDPSIDLNDWFQKFTNPTTPNSVYKKIIIPKELKWTIRNILDQMNITERILFPGLDGLAQWLSRHYGPPR